MFRFFDIANGLTLTALLAALGSVAFAVHGHVGYALVAMIISGLCDIFDGMLARRLSRSEVEQEFGGTLDSLVDGCAFGFAPSVLFYLAGMQSVPETILWALFPMCVVWRVTYFEVVGLQAMPANENCEGAASAVDSTRFYTGLPSTYAALLLPLASLLGFVDEHWFRWGVGLTALLLCWLMTSAIRVPKPPPLAYVAFVVMAIVASVLFIVNDSLLPAPGRSS
jgi:CDP-diacylglycerol--serine O-phosphatidyltransferase